MSNPSVCGRIVSYSSFDMDFFVITVTKPVKDIANGMTMTRAATERRFFPVPVTTNPTINITAGIAAKSSVRISLLLLSFAK